MSEGITEGHSDVLVIGAGPAGCAAGIAAARAGAQVCVIDRARFPRDKTCGDAISNLGMEVLTDLGAAADVLSGPHALVHEGHAVFPNGQRVKRRYAQPGYIVRRYDLDDALRRALERSGARLLQGQSASGLSLTADRVDGAYGPNLRWQAKIVIAADGHGSVALPHVAPHPPRGAHLALAATAYMRGVRFPQGPAVADHYFEHELPLGYGWVFPDVDGLSNIGVYQRVDVYRQGRTSLKTLLADFIARHPERFEGARIEGRERSWSLPIAEAPYPRTARGLVLVGDAGGFIDPLSGEGIWQALFTGTRAGEVAAQAARQGELSPALRNEFERSCKRRIGRTSQAKRVVQHMMREVVDRKLYRSRLLRGALQAGYGRGALQMTKH